jgi:hypothetical protein
MKTIFSALILILLLNSCTKFFATPNLILPELNNTWNLQEVSGGFSGGGRPISPNEAITFKARGTYKGSLKDFPSSGIFTVSGNADSENPPFHYTVTFSRNTLFYYVAISQDTLNLISSGNDGYNYLFIRNK